FPSVFPAIGDLPGHPKPTRHLRGGIVLAEQRGSLFPAPFHLGMISCLRHARTIDRHHAYVTKNMSLYYARLNKSEILGELPLAMLDGSARIRQAIEQEAQRVGVKLNVRLRFSSHPQLAQAVQNLHVAAVMPK